GLDAAARRARGTDEEVGTGVEAHGGLLSASTHLAGVDSEGVACSCGRHGLAAAPAAATSRPGSCPSSWHPGVSTGLPGATCAPLRMYATSMPRPAGGGQRAACHMTGGYTLATAERRNPRMPRACRTEGDTRWSSTGWRVCLAS